MNIVIPKATRTVGQRNILSLRLIVAGKCALSVLLLTCIVGCSHKSSPTSPDIDTSGQYDVDASTVGLWHFNESSGTVVADATPYHSDGLAVGTTITGQGRFGRARHFAGKGNENTGDYVKIHFSDVMRTESRFTLEAWFLVDDFEKNMPEISDDAVLMSCFTGVSDVRRRGYELGLQRNGSWEPVKGDSLTHYKNTGARGGSASFSVYFSVPYHVTYEHGESFGTTQVAVGTFTAADNGKWHHVAVSMRKNESSNYYDLSGDIRVVLDGKDSISFLASAYPDFQDVAWLYLGSGPFADSSTMLGGILDEVRISDVVR